MGDSNYISPAVLAGFKDEYEHRTTAVRKQISELLEHAIQMGDLSENFEYHDAKDRQRANEERILELDAIIKSAIVVDEKSGGNRIDVGTTFVASKAGKESVFQIVGVSEADPIAGKISNESPIGRAFLGRAVGDAVSISTPSGDVEYKVESIK